MKLTMPSPQSLSLVYFQVQSDLAFHGKRAAGAFYRVPFTEALDLVRTRKVHVVNGFCFVPQDEMVS